MKDNINFYSNPLDYTPTEEEIEEEITRSLEWDLFKEEEYRLRQERWSKETTNEKNQTVDGGRESNTSMEIDLN